MAFCFFFLTKYFLDLPFNVFFSFFSLLFFLNAVLLRKRIVADPRRGSGFRPRPHIYNPYAAPHMPKALLFVESLSGEFYLRLRPFSRPIIL